MEIVINNETMSTEFVLPIAGIKSILEDKGFHFNDFYLLSNGKIVNDETKPLSGKVYVIPRLVGGKGGFGSMLRAIGAQIEKTTNREACRDLSGRRLRDINEEQRLKNWISQQADREKEAKERKQKKLERLCEQPKHEFKDEQYDAERSALPEKVEDAVLKGLEASASCSNKRKSEDKKDVKKKKPKLWLDDDLDDLSSSEELESDEEQSCSSEKTGEKSQDIKDNSNEKPLTIEHDVKENSNEKQDMKDNTDESVIEEKKMVLNN